MGLFRKKIPSGPFIAKEEKTMPGFKPAKDRPTLLLCANASGTTTQNLRALKNLC
jgi:hypothetical protein